MCMQGLSTSGHYCIIYMSIHFLGPRPLLLRALPIISQRILMAQMGSSSLDPVTTWASALKQSGQIHSWVWFAYLLEFAIPASLIDRLSPQCWLFCQNRWRRQLVSLMLQSPRLLITAIKKVWTRLANFPVIWFYNRWSIFSIFFLDGLNPLGFDNYNLYKTWDAAIPEPQAYRTASGPSCHLFSTIQLW